MKRVSRILTVAATAILMLTLGIWGSSWLDQQAQAQTEEEAAQEQASTERTITVSGQGRISARPDTAVVRLGVQTQADTAQAALDENSANMQAVISTTLDAGIAEEDIQTQGIRLQPIYDRSEDEQQQPEVTGYRASNTVEVTVRDLDNVGSVLDAVVEAGSNTIDSIRFEVSDTDEALAQAREAAVNNAREKAEQLTSLVDAELGEVITIRETGFTPPTPVALETVERAAVPVQPGTQFVEASVEITWLIR